MALREWGLCPKGSLSARSRLRQPRKVGTSVTMDERDASVSCDEAWADAFARTLQQQRSRLQEFLVVQRQRFQRARTELAEQADKIAAEIERSHRESLLSRQELELRSAEVQRQAEALIRLREEIDARHAEWQKTQERLIQQYETLAAQLRKQEQELALRQEGVCRRQTEIEAAEARLRHDQQALTLARQEHTAEAEHVAALRKKLQEDAAALEKQRAELASKRSRTLAQRRRIAEELRQQRAAHLRELQQRRAELESLRSARGQESGESENVRALREDRDRLAARLAEAEAQLAQSASEGDYRRRYQMALDDVRELKARIQELERQVAQARAGGGQSAAVSVRSLDWEAEKRRIMAALEAQFDADDPEAARQRLKIEDVIRTTDKALAERDREIEGLKKILEDQSKNLGTMAVGASALGEVVDRDAIIQEERERLRRLQNEWEEKLRQAEVEISIERAKIARERVKLEERAKELQQRVENSSSGGDAGKPGPSDKPPRGRWLARLGLKEPEER